MNADEYLKKSAEIQAALKTNAKPWIMERAKAFFDANPLIEAVRWDQYAPYFNDGDPCVFSVHEATFKGPKSEDEEEDDEDEDGFLESCYWDKEKEPTVIDRAYTSWSDVGPGAFPEDVFEAAFGTDCRITVNRALEIEHEDCEHD